MTEQNGNIKVLVVDDMPEIRRIIRHVLNKSLRSYIIEAENGLDAISKLLEHHPDLIITDLAMPRMTGLEFIGFVQQRDDLAQIPIIILTSQSDEQTQIQALGLHVKAFLQKPFNPQKLLQTLTDIVPKEYFIQQVK